MEKRLLQLAILAGGFVPVSRRRSRAPCAERGFSAGGRARRADSHFRYLSGLLLGIGL